MDNRDLRILVVEDDRTLGSAIEKALKRAGYSTQLTNSAAKAKAASKITEFHGVFVDCMLPDQNGVDLVKDLRKESHEDPVIVLTSGIYKDKSFARDAMLKAGAKHFLVKPFDIEELVNTFDQEFQSLISGNHAPLHSLVAQSDYSINDRILAIENTQTVHGYDLPLVFCTLAAQGICGDLEITYDGEHKSIVGFQDGKIDKVIHHDTESYFGVLLVEKGFTSYEEVEEGLAQNDNKPIGERLVDASSLSPHAIEIVQHDQMVIRISKTIFDTSADIKFTPMKRDSAVAIEPVLISHLVADWINTKLTPGWLESFYTPWLEYRVVRGPDFSKFDLLKNNPIVAPIASIFSRGEWPTALQDLMTEEGINESELLKALHYLLLQRVVIFEHAGEVTQNWDGRRNRLKKIATAMKDQNHYEVLGLSTKARPSEVNRVYQDLAKSLHPDKLPPNAPQDIQDLTHQVFSRIVEAYQVLSNESKRQKYVKTLEVGLAEEILQAESMFEQGSHLLGAKRYRDARKTFQKAMKIKGHRSDLMVYICWALIMEKRKRVSALDLYEKIRSLLSQIPHEDRHSPHYFFVRGLYYQLKGEFNKAYAAFRHTLTLDHNFMEAKREISLMKSHASRGRSMMTDDLSQVVTRFFKKKSS